MMRFVYTLIGTFFVAIFTLISLSIATHYDFGTTFILVILIGAGILLGDIIKDFVEGR